MTTYEPPHGKINKVSCTPSEDLNQSGHPPSLIRIFAVRMTTPWVLSYPLTGRTCHFVGFVMKWFIFLLISYVFLRRVVHREQSSSNRDRTNFCSA